jgi:outer membrane protein assembly factor BamB
MLRLLTGSPKRNAALTSLKGDRRAIVEQPISFRRLIILFVLYAFLGFAWKVFTAGHLSSDAASRGSSAADSVRANKPPEVGGFSGVLTSHNDNARIGANLHETILTPLNVNAGEFGKLFTVRLDGDVYAQPLYVAKVAVPSQGVHNIVYVATENNTVYAIDADDPTGLILWSNHLGPALSFEDVPLGSCTVIVPVVGITGTPVIEPSTNTMYVVARTFEHSKHEYRLYALDIFTGKQRPGSPTVISASVPGGGSQNGKVVFDPVLQLQRPGLALAGGEIYIGFGSTCDYGNYHGWLLAYNASTLEQTSAFVATPSTSRGGIWQSGAAPSVDTDGNLYVVTGDGTFNANHGGSDYGDTFLKLSLRPDDGWKVLDYFTPFDQERFDLLNEDLGSSGTVLLPDQPGPHPHLLVSAAKSGTIYVIDQDNMGHFRRDSDGQIVQTLPGALPKIDSTAAYWEGARGRWVYINGVGGPLQQYSLVEGKLSSRPIFQSDELFGYPGSTPSVSADGKTNGIVWVVGIAEPDTRTVIGAYFHRIALSFRGLTHEPKIFFRKLVLRIKLLFHSPSIFWGALKKLLPRRTPEALNRPAILRAYDAREISNLLYDSTEAPQDRDQANLPVKFVVPTIANGKVYFGTQGHLDVYGLLKK